MTSRIETQSDATTQKLMRELKNVVKEAEELLSSHANGAEGITSDTRARIASSLESAKATYGDLKEKAIAGAKRTDEMIHENPYPALGVAFGVGALVGFLITRSNK